MAAQGAEGSGRDRGCVLSLAGRSLRLEGGPEAVANGVVARMCPPAEVAASVGDADWTVSVDALMSGGEPAMPTSWSFVLGDRGWPRLAPTPNSGASAGGVGQYHPNDPLAVITADYERRLTEVHLPDGESDAARWVDWLVRTYFAAALLANDWVLLHAAAVCFGGQAVIIGGESGAGKSSLAHLLCQNLGAEFLADDLVFVGPGGEGAVQVVGWPTRVSLPTRLAAPAEGAHLESRRVSSSWHRERSLTSPAVYCAAYGITRAASGRAAAVVLLDRTGRGAELGQLRADVSHHAFMTDRLGLLGCPDGEHRTDAAVAAELLEHLPVLRLRTGEMTTTTAEQVWSQLGGVLARGCA